MGYEFQRGSMIEIVIAMKRSIVLSLVVFATVCLLSGLSMAQQPVQEQSLPTQKKTLIVYLSRTNNTKAIAEIVHQKVGGNLVALELETPYPADYHTTVQQGVQGNETVFPFKTNGGYGPGNTFQTVRELCPRSTVLEGFSTRGGSERDGQYLAIKDARAEDASKEVESWLRKIGILK